MSAPWVTVALAFLNKKEVPGHSSNPDIIEMYRLCGHKEQDDAVPWCAAFAGACLSLAGYKNSGSLAARSYENFGRNLLGAPERGAIVVFPRGAANSGKGHVGFVERMEGDQIVYVSGNLSDMVKRDKRPKSEMIACRRPTETAPLPQTFLPTILQIAPNEAPPHLRESALSGQVMASSVTEVMAPPVSEVKAFDELTEGALGPAVEALQKALRDAGVNPGEIDGEFGPNTRNAVAMFQSSRRLPATGVADERTLSLLNMPAPAPTPIVIGPQDIQRREDREQFLERLVTQLVDVAKKREADRPEASAADILSNLLGQALAAKPNGQAAGANAGADAVLQRVLQAALQSAGAKAAANGAALPTPDAGAVLQRALQATLQGAGAKAAANGAALPTPDEIAKVLPLSSIDKVLGGEALVGMKTPAAVVAYAALSIFQTLGIAGPVTATATQPPSTTSQVLLTLIGAFGALGGLSKVDRAVRALSVIATKR